jgi:hypothetical protein
MMGIAKMMVPGSNLYRHHYITINNVVHIHPSSETSPETSSTMTCTIFTALSDWEDYDTFPFASFVTLRERVLSTSTAITPGVFSIDAEQNLTHKLVYEARSPSLISVIARGLGASSSAQGTERSHGRPFA